jgi:GxxExxY protein
MTPNEAARIVIGAALRVHSALGAGVLESTYDACFYYELTKAGLRFEHQVHLPVVYEGVELSAAYRVDFIVESCLVVEIKYVERVLPVHRAQLLSYLKLSGHKLGLLLNFNVAHMRNGVHRVINGPESEL